MLVSADPVSEAIMDVIRMNGYAVEITQEGEAYHAAATHYDGDTRSADGTNRYSTVCTLADEGGIGIDRGDGQQVERACRSQWHV